MGSLYLAKDPKIGRLVAIKLVRQEFDSPDARQRFAREAQSAGTLRHPNIVTIFDVDEHEGLPFIAMEYIDGETLAEIVKRKALLPIPKRLQWVEDLCAGLAYAHRQGVIHRDIKPANLMVDTEGTLKILDFGLARRDASKFTQSHVIIGTPNYMSPEQIRGGNIDTRSDIFSVGALLYEVLTYREAFPGAVHQTMHKILHEEPEPLENYITEVDPKLTKILARALVKDRDGRYPDLSLMKNDLADARQRMESAGVVSDAATMPLDKSARFGSGPTETVKGQPISSGSGRKPGSSHASKRFQTNRQSLQRRRSEQITALLDEARRLFEAGDLDKARDKCDEALMFDPDHPGGLQLMDDIASESDRQQVAQWIKEARIELQKGQLDRAEALVAQARQLQPDSPDVQQVQEAIDTTRREIERTRQLQETMRRARARFAEGGYEAAIRAAGEVLAIDPDNAAAKDLQKRAQEAIEQAATRAERDAAAQSAVASARKLFESGDKDGAIRKLQAFTPKHDLVSAFLATLKGEKVAEPDPVRAAGETAHILRGARGEAPNLPARRNFLVAAAVFIAVVVGASLYFRPWQRTAPSSPAGTNPPASQAENQQPASSSQAAASQAGPQPVAPPPLAPVTVPAEVAKKAEDSQDDKDILAAYQLLSTDVAGAQRLAAAIRKRNPKHPELGKLATAIDTRVAEEKKREDAVAAANAAAIALEEEKKRAAALEEQKRIAEEKARSAPAFTVAPGGAFVADSAPPTPLLRGQAERPEIEKAVQQWAAAFSQLDVKALSQIRALSEDESRRWRNTFNNMSSYKMNVRLVGDPQIIDNDAIAPVEEIAVYTAKRGGISITQQPVKTNYRLRKIGNEWKLLVPSTPMPPNPSQ
jgi:serine/threonine protein kinase